MTLYAVTIPKWGLAMEEAKLVSWLVQEGASVTRGQELAEIESSKIANVLEASVAGVLRRKVAVVGDTRPVGALLAVLSDGGEDDSAIETFVADFTARFAMTPRVAVASPDDRTIVIDGRAANFTKVPATGPLRGAPILLLHGLGGNIRSWLLSQYDLAIGRDVYAVDLPGHGASSKDVGDGTPEALAVWVAAFLEGQNLESAHLVGHSLGAVAALALALDRPDWIKSLTVICSPGLGGTLNQTYLDGFLAATRRKELKPVIEMLFAEPKQVTREMLDELIAYKRIDGVTDALRMLIDHALSGESLGRLRARVGTIRAPMLAIMGKQDRIVPPHSMEGLPARVVVIQSAGHMPQLEAASALNRLVAEFVDGLE